MFKIGQLAKQAGVSVETIRYYESLGLLCPVYVDKFTGYRFYDKSSELKLKEILYYKELSFSLEEIKNMNTETLKHKLNSIQKNINILNKNSQTVSSKLKEHNMKQFEFINDPDLIGKWTFVKELYKGKPFKNAMIKRKIDYFCPNGETTFCDKWTKGLLIYYDRNNDIKSYQYEIIKDLNKELLKIQKSENSVFVYEKEDNLERSIEEVYEREQNQSYEFCEDLAFNGIWKSVGITQDLEDSASIKRTEKLYMQYIIAIPSNNFVTVRYKDGKQEQCLYSKGYIIRNSLRKEYLIKNVEGKELLFCQWNKDYVKGSNYADYIIFEKVN